jgi:hypothetical protein
MYEPLPCPAIGDGCLPSVCLCALLSWGWWYRSLVLMNVERYGKNDVVLRRDRKSH